MATVEFRADVALVTLHGRTIRIATPNLPEKRPRSGMGALKIARKQLEFMDRVRRATDGTEVASFEGDLSAINAYKTFVSSIQDSYDGPVTKNEEAVARPQSTE